MKRELLFAAIALSVAGCASIQANGTRATERNRPSRAKRSGVLRLRRPRRVQVHRPLAV